MPNKFWILRHYFHWCLCPKLILVCISFSLIHTTINGAGFQYKKQQICWFNFKQSQSWESHTSLRWQLTSVHSKFVGHSIEINWQSNIKAHLEKNFHLKWLSTNSQLLLCIWIWFIFEMKKFSIRGRELSLKENPNQNSNFRTRKFSIRLNCSKRVNQLWIIWHE